MTNNKNKNELLDEVVKCLKESYYPKDEFNFKVYEEYKEKYSYEGIFPLDSYTHDYYNAVIKAVCNVIASYKE